MNDSGVIFYSKKTRTSFYDKQAESKDPNAFGILRQEKSIRDAQVISKRLGSNSNRLRQITNNVARKELEDDLIKLGINKRCIPTSSMLWRKISKCGFTKPKMIRLYGFARMLSDMQKDEIMNVGGLTAKQFSYYRREINKLGSVPVMTRSDTPLPALAIKL
jgi:hypothetical protein